MITIDLHSDIDKLYFALRESPVYDITNPSVSRLENFLIHWLNGEEYPQSEQIIKGLHDKFKEVYTYNGILYRGIEIKKEDYIKRGLRFDYLTSFTDLKDVAEYFGGESSLYGSSRREGTVKLLIKVNAENAFALDEFLLDIQKKTVNEDLQIVIEERIWENEKIHRFSLDEAVMCLIKN